MDAETVYAAFNARLARFIRSRVPDATTADDLLQEVYVRILKGTLHDRDKLQAWVYQIARNVIIDYYRRADPTESMSDLIPAADAMDEGSPDEAFRLRLAASVHEMITLLPDDYREALLLSEVQGLTQKEIAERLGISLPAAKSRVQRAKKMLRELFQLCCELQYDRQGKVIDYHPRRDSCHNDACRADHCDCACEPQSASLSPLIRL